LQFCLSFDIRLELRNLATPVVAEQPAFYCEGQGYSFLVRIIGD